ncbi:hypothetical protein AVEN_15905-1 [Araneus ventricosus]|uniref:Uncharacterized protein n=1 Tax=Araneus ventricosus TaxID=182803 RepID=A0A4Y2WPV6_ARAVE|nr:hypothetical protein AVEN_15905-1 [Araneus ventricosus]
MGKVRLLPSGVQGPVPTEAALSSFTMNRSPIVLDISCMELEKRNLFESPALSGQLKVSFPNGHKPYQQLLCQSPNQCLRGTNELSNT